MRDGRSNSWLAEYRAQQIGLGFYKHDGSQVKGSDGLIGDELTEVRSLAKINLQLQESFRKGSGRSCSQEELMYDIGNKSYFIIVDTDQPDWRCVLVEAEFFLLFAKRLELKPTGWKREKFWHILGEYYTLEEEIVLIKETTNAT